MHVLTCGTMTGLGDIIAQNCFNPEKPWDYVRTLKFASVGALYVGPILTFWYKFLDKRFGMQFSAKKLFTDQGLFNPVLTSGFIALNAGLSGIAPLESLKLAKSEILDVMKAGWPFWITVQFVNFKFIALDYRVLVVQFAALFWNTFLAWKADQANKKLVLVIEDIDD